MPRYPKSQRLVRLAALTVTVSLVGLPAGAGLAETASSQDQPEIPEDVLAALTSELPPTKLTRIEYRGNQIILDETAPTGAGTSVYAYFRGSDGQVRRRSVMSDETGRYTLAIDATDLPDYTSIFVDEWHPDGPAFRKRFFGAEDGGRGPCTGGGDEDPPPCLECVDEGSADMFNGGREARYGGVNLVDGAVPTSLPLFRFDTRSLGMDFKIHHQSRKFCDGEMGQSASHSFNAAIVQTGEKTAFFQTSNLELHPFSGESFFSMGKLWRAPEGFFSELRKDTLRNRWILTTRNGTELQFIAGATDQPGPLISIRDPNGNMTRINRDYSGFVDSVVTDLGQELKFRYNEEGRMSSVTDHLGRTWTYAYDELGRLTTIDSPVDEYAEIEPGTDFIESDLPHVLATDSRTTTLSYDDPQYPYHLTGITDETGIVVSHYTYYHDPPHAGRVKTTTINSRDIAYIYDPPSTATPAPLPVLDPGNSITRVIDREGNVTDYEMHGPEGGPLGGAGKYGLRRRVTWTERGKGNPPLREGEPLAWEQRRLYDCDCLRPKKIAQPFRYEGSGAWVDDHGRELGFDDHGMPLNHPTEVFEYNENGQATAYKYTLDHHQTGVDGKLCDRNQSTDTICWERTYDTFENLSRELTYTEPRAFDDHPIYAGLDFTHEYYYDAAGNRTRHVAPTVTRGVDGEQQVIEETWTYNDDGQVTGHTDPNGNVTTYTYFEGPATGGDVNSQGEYGGYLASVTRGAEGSVDAETNLTTTYKVNAVGMVTRRTDPAGNHRDYEYNDLGETIREIDPEVTLRNGQKVRYETRTIYDGAGNPVMIRRSNVDVAGNVAANDFIDRSQSFAHDHIRLSVRLEVDGDDDHDLVTRYGYDDNDQLVVVERPEGNRTFHVYDERGLRFKTFYGVAPSLTGQLIQGYPQDKRAESLGGTAFVGLTTSTYDARTNVVRTRDGRMHFTDHFYDFYNRRIATSDPLGNGSAREYDAASNVLAEWGGAVAGETGRIDVPLATTYSRYDETGRLYQSVRDVEPASDESALVDPTQELSETEKSASLNTVFDAGSRVRYRLDANGNATSYLYDAANRTRDVTDALGNVVAYGYDDNSNVQWLWERELPPPGVSQPMEEYITRRVYDELNRQLESHDLGLDGVLEGHVTSYAYDSRDNACLIGDAEGNFSLSTYDDQDRLITVQRFHGDPVTSGPAELLHYEHVYDGNGRKVEDVAIADLSDPEDKQITRYAYDSLDRLVRVVYADSDDPIDGSADGGDGIYDRVEMTYDENSNLKTTTDQRGVVITNNRDEANRLRAQTTTLPSSVFGTTQQEFDYDALNRLTDAKNNYSHVHREYDDLSRLEKEIQSIRLDGSGFSSGWENPVEIKHTYDPQSNRTTMTVGSSTDLNSSDLYVRYDHDDLNRTTDIDAEYFDKDLHDVVDYTYFGPWRVHTKTYGNGAVLTRSYDGKRRVRDHVWSDGTADDNLLLGFHYDYDKVDNPLYEQFLHDSDLYDNYFYNGRYELTGVIYRSEDSLDYRADKGATSVRNDTVSSTFAYDDNFNRLEAWYGDPFGNEMTHDKYHPVNPANEYTEIDRDVGGMATSFVLQHDAAGNMIRFPGRPGVGSEAGKDVELRAGWDAFNLLFSVTAPDWALDEGKFEEEYRYDPLRRRIGKFAGSADGCESCGELTGRRYIYDDWSVVGERVIKGNDFSETSIGIDEDIERVYVGGRTIDEPIVAAIDGDRDGELRGELDKNDARGTDFEYYYLCNGSLGSSMALLDPDDNGRILEYYRYEAYGEVTFVPLVGNGKASDLIPGERHVESPDDLLADRELTLARHGSTRGSQFLNPYLFTGRRLDMDTMLYHYRHRYLESGQGRFISRDPFYSTPSLYQYVEGRTTMQVDPYGLRGEKCSGALLAVTATCWKEEDAKEMEEILRELATTYPACTVTGPKKVGSKFTIVEKCARDTCGRGEKCTRVSKSRHQYFVDEGSRKAGSCSIKHTFSRWQGCCK
ncbi:MAG: hypothetical protein GY856_15565 [bacterium]|nr:hypothetical protein [bacterium]